MDGSLRILKHLMLLSLIISLTSGYKNSGRRRHTLRHHTLHKQRVTTTQPPFRVTTLALYPDESQELMESTTVTERLTNQDKYIDEDDPSPRPRKVRSSPAPAPESNEYFGKRDRMNQRKREVRNERPVRQLEESADEWGGIQGEGRSFGGYGGVVASKVSEHQSKTPSSPKSGDEAKQAAKEKAEEGARKGRAVDQEQHNRRAEFLEEDDLELSREARKISSEEHHHGHGRHHGSHHGRRSRPRHGSGHDISQESHSAEYGSDEGYHHRK